MAIEQTNEKTLDAIINEMTTTVENSKEQIFQIREESMEELEWIKSELEDVKIKVKDYILEGEKLKQELKSSKKLLTIVSSRFDRYTEADIKKVYEKTLAKQTELAIFEKEEKIARDRRDDLERRIRRLSSTTEQASDLGQRVSVVLKYLQDDFRQVNEIIQSAQEKQEFGLKIIEAQEMERKRLSREIHDGPAQMLANILIRSEIVDLAFKEGDVTQALNQMKDIRSNIRVSLQEVRRIIYDLRPMALDDLGLFPTIKKHVENVSEYQNTPIELRLLGEERRLDPAHEVAIFRLIQEAIQNAIKHAKASTIQVVIEVLQDKITVIVKDDGIGFDQSRKKESSFGLVGMKERVEILEGELTIDSKPGKGTTIKVIIPNAPKA